MEPEGIQTAVATIGRDNYRTQLEVRTHQLIGDEPADIGGSDLGPRPGDFLRMGLACCTAITLRMYSDRKKWNVEEIRVTVSNGPFSNGTHYKTIIEIEGSLDDEQKHRLLKIAKLCPVHKTLTNPIAIETVLNVV